MSLCCFLDLFSQPWAHNPLYCRLPTFFVWQNVKLEIFNRPLFTFSNLPRTHKDLKRILACSAPVTLQWQCREGGTSKVALGWTVYRVRLLSSLLHCNQSFDSLHPTASISLHGIPTSFLSDQRKVSWKVGQVWANSHFSCVVVEDGSQGALSSSKCPSRLPKKMTE